MWLPCMLPVPGPCRACGCLAPGACGACAAARPQARPLGRACSWLPGEGWQGREPAELLSPVEAFLEGRALLAPPLHRSPLFCSRCSGRLSPFPTAGAVCASPLAGGATAVMCTLLASSSSLGLRSLSVPSLWNVPSCAAVWLLLPVCLCCRVSPVVPHIFWKLRPGGRSHSTRICHPSAVSAARGWASIDSTARSHPL